MSPRMCTHLFLCGSLILFASVGCGGGSHGTVVFGKVTVDGQPLEDGDISFQPPVQSAGTPSSAAISNGEYRLPVEFGLVPGTYNVRVNGYRPSTDTSTTIPGSNLDRPPESPGTVRKDQYLPAKFNTESKIESLVVPDGQEEMEKNFDLKK